MSAGRMRERRRNIPLKIALGYAVVGGLWILFSDALTRLLFASDPVLEQRVESFKGAAFVVVTGVILYGLLERYLGRIEIGERALRASERRLESIVATIPSVVLIVDRLGVVISANRAAERVFRTREGSVVGRRFDDPEWKLETLDGRALAIGDHPVERVLATGESVYDVRYALAHEDGSRIVLSTHASPLLDDTGELIAVITATRDVTDSYVAEQKLVHVNRLYSMLSQTNETIVRARDEERLYADACRITVEYGQFRMAWIGLVDTETHHVVPAAHAGDDRGFLDGLEVTTEAGEEAGDPVGTAARRGRTVVSNDIAHDPSTRPWASRAAEHGFRSMACLPLKLESGTYGVLTMYAGEEGFFDAEELALLEDLAGDIAFGATHIRNERERDTAERALRRWRDIFDKTKVGVVTADPGSGRITAANPAYAEMHGYDCEDLIGMPLALVFAPEERVMLPERIRRAEENGHDAYESVHLRKDGTTFPVSVDVTAVRDDAGEVLYRIATVADITERRAAERELESYREHLEDMVEERASQLEEANRRLAEATEAKSRFLANMSHELRTPLNAVIGFTGMMMEGKTGGLTAEQLKQLGLVQRAGRQLLTLVTDILDLSKIEAGRMQVEASEVDVGSLVEDVVATARPIAEDKGLALSVTVEEPVPALRTDRAKLAEILVNLLGNAVQYTERGEVSLDVRVEGASLVFTVRDTGIGIAEEDLTRIFDEFEQARPAGGRRVLRGTGLGLAISKRLSELLGGSISAASEPGRGSTFTVTVPPLPGPEDASANAEGVS